MGQSLRQHIRNRHRKFQGFILLHSYLVIMFPLAHIFLLIFADSAFLKNGKKIFLNFSHIFLVSWTYCENFNKIALLIQEIFFPMYHLLTRGLTEGKKWQDNPRKPFEYVLERKIRSSHFITFFIKAEHIYTEAERRVAWSKSCCDQFSSNWIP